MISLYEQVLIIIHCFIIGLFLGITYDSLNVINNVICNKKSFKSLIIKYIIELCYWFLIVFITIKYIIKNINYQIRVYTVLFFIIGVIIYYQFLAKKHRIRLYFIVYLLKNKINPFLKKVLLPSELFCFFKNIKLFKNLKMRIKRKTKNEENIIANTNDNN